MPRTPANARLGFEYNGMSARVLFDNLKKGSGMGDPAATSLCESSRVHIWQLRYLESRLRRDRQNARCRLGDLL